jgi:hypothetical protein
MTEAFCFFFLLSLDYTTADGTSRTDSSRVDQNMGGLQESLCVFFFFFLSFFLFTDYPSKSNVQSIHLLSFYT